MILSSSLDVKCVMIHDFGYVLYRTIDCCLVGRLKGEYDEG